MPLRTRSATTVKATGMHGLIMHPENFRKSLLLQNRNITRLDGSSARLIFFFIKTYIFLIMIYLYK